MTEQSQLGAESFALSAGEVPEPVAPDADGVEARYVIDAVGFDGQIKRAQVRAGAIAIRLEVVRKIGRPIGMQTEAQARDWLERTLDRVQERGAALGLTRAPETALERLQAARASRGAVDTPSSALERLQAARAGRGEDRGVEIERNIESAGHALTQQDRERERVLEQERALERQRAAEREGPSHER